MNTDLCDQIWQNFKSQTIFMGLLKYLAKWWAYFGTFYCRKWPKIENII